MAENVDPSPQRPRYIQNNWKRPQLVDPDNNIYFVSKKIGDCTYLICAKAKLLKCQGRAVIKVDEATGIETVRFKGSHNHFSSLAKVEAKQLDQEALATSISNAAAPPSRILADSLNAPIPEAVSLARRKSSSLIRSIQFQRKKEKGHTLAAPDSMEAIARQRLPEEYQKTSIGDQFLVLKDYVSDEDRSKCMLVFMSPLAKEIMRTSDQWASDGTFKTCPRPFGDTGQIYMVFAEIPSGLLLPCVFAILPDKTSASYQRMWGAVYEELAGADQSSCSPASISMDFEIAPANEFKTYFPEAEISGCFFHWRKALLDQIGKKGCKSFFNRNVEFQALVTKCVAVSLVPVAKVPEYFSLVEEDFDNIEDDLEEGACDWFNYFSRTFVGRKQRVTHKIVKSGSRKSPIFAHSVWNKYTQFLEGRPTTTNKAEAFNGAWKLRGEANPSFWSTLDAFKREEALVAQKWREQTMRVRSDQPESPTEGTSRQIAQRNKLAQIQNLLRQEGTVPAKQYLSMVANLLNEI